MSGTSKFLGEAERKAKRRVERIREGETDGGHGLVGSMDQPGSAYRGRAEDVAKERADELVWRYRGEDW